MPIFNLNRKTIEIYILLGMLSLLYIPVFSDLIKAWNTKPQSSHGFFILPVSLYIVFTKRQQLSHIKLQTSTVGILFVIIGILTYIFGAAAKISTLSNISLLLNIIGILLSLGGLVFTRKLLFPVLFLAFMFPVPDAIYVSLTAPLKLFTSHLSVEILQIFGFPVFREGNIIQFPNMNLEVVEACSGLQSLISYLILGVLISYFLPKANILTKSIYIAIAFPISITINVLRIITTGILANYYNPKIAQGFFHEFSGMLLFIIGLICYFALYLVIQRESARTKMQARH